MSNIIFGCNALSLVNMLSGFKLNIIFIKVMSLLIYTVLFFIEGSPKRFKDKIARLRTLTEALKWQCLS